MKISTRINPSILAAATGMLQQFIPELSPSALVDALKAYGGESDTVKQNLVAPLSRRDAAGILGVSLPTINRLLNSGKLRRIRITPGVVRVDPESVRMLLDGEAETGVTTITLEGCDHVND